MEKTLPVGKLPVELFKQMLADIDAAGDEVVLGPGIGLDCAVVRNGDRYLVYTSDPITFASDEAGWYLVHINANDIATTGADPRWLLSTMLLPSGQTTEGLVRQIAGQVLETCQILDIHIIGGHTEVTAGLDRPILVGTMVGEVAPEKLVTPGGAREGDRLLLTKGVPLEATAILSREFPDQLKGTVSKTELEAARNYLYTPGISVVSDAKIAVSSGRVTAMHDPTEGGLYAALWELAQASDAALEIDLASIPVSPLSRRICEEFNIDPLGAIASGSLLLTVAQEDAGAICQSLGAEGVPCTEIGWVRRGDIKVFKRGSADELLPYPEQDEIGKAYE